MKILLCTYIQLLSICYGCIKIQHKGNHHFISIDIHIYILNMRNQVENFISIDIHTCI